MRRYITLQDYEMEIVRQVGTSCTARPHEYIYRIGDEADNVYLIESGRVKFFQGARVSHVRYSGDLFGVAEMLQQTKRSMFACAITPVQYLVIERAAFIELLSCEPFLTVKLAKTLSRMIADIDTKTQQAASRWVLERLAYLLLKISESNNNSEALLCEALPANTVSSFSVADLAAMVGIGEQTMVTFLKAMRQLQCLEIRGEIVVIKDREQLKRLIN